MAPTQPGGTTPTPSEPLSPAALAPHFPQLEILECLGRGGMGVVYKARQKALNRFVALKILAPERSTDSGFAERFTAEARTLASLNHPNIVTIHDFGESGGFYHLVMEYVDGVNLRQAMTAGRFTPEQALAIVPPVCEALQYAHDHGVVHRDIKPENLLLDQQGRVKVADFGIAKLMGSATAGGPDAAAADKVPASAPPAGASGPETLGASAAGTPQYMAPEHRARGPVDHRADIYSLGVVLYELLTGEPPGASLANPSRKIQIDVRLDEVVLRALAVEPELRFQTATEFRTRVEALTAPATPAPVQPPPQKLASVPSPYRALVPWALAYQWWAGGLFLLAGIEGLLWATTDSLYVSWIFKRLLSGFFITGIFLLRSLARQKADQWLDSLDTGGRRALNRQAALFFPTLAGAIWMALPLLARVPWVASYPIFRYPPSVQECLALGHLGVAAFPWVLLRQASNRSPSLSLMGRLTNNFTLPVVLLTAIVLASMSGGWLESLAHRISRAFHRAPVVPGTWPAVALSILGPRSPREVPNNPVLQVLPAIPRVEGPGPTAFKDIVLERFTNQWDTIDPSCSSFTPLRPGESLEFWTKRSDGHLESHNEHPTIFQHGESRSQLLTMVFQLPETFLLFKLPLIEELRPKLEGRSLRLPEGQPMTLFGLTNRDGSWLAGGLTFRRTLPEDRGPTMATVWLKQLPVSAGNEISLIGSTSVPPGHALRPRLGGSELGQGFLHWRAYLFRESIHLDVSLFWRPRHGLQGSSNFDSAPALKQLEALAANGPLQVTNGHPRTLFAVTNALGESYSLAIELLSAKDTDP